MGRERGLADGLTVALGLVRIGLAGEQTAPVARQLLRVLDGTAGLAAGRAVSVPVLTGGLRGQDPMPDRVKGSVTHLPHVRAAGATTIVHGHETCLVTRALGRT
jgi:hypothetical protein